MDSEILIINGTVMDGSGSAPFKADILIKGDQIENIGNIQKQENFTILDAHRLIVAPGFIDIHTHLDFLLPSPHHAEVLQSWAFMGVTTFVAGLCGFSPAPINHDYERDLNIYWNFALPHDGLKYDWTTFIEFLDHLEKVGQAFNVAMLVGHNTIRMNTMGFQARFANHEEVSEMKIQLHQALDEGAFGFSIGLGYVRGIFSHTDEIAELASVLKEYDRPLVAHTRGLSSMYDKAVEEVINIVEYLQIPLQISHNSSVSLKAGRKAQKVIKKAIKRGVQIGFDNLPYASGSSTAFCALPPLLLDGGIDECYKRLRDPAIRKQVIHDIKKVRVKWPNWDHNFWTDKYLEDSLLAKLLGVKILMHGFRQEKNKKFENMPIKKIAKTLKKNYIEAFLDLILEEPQGLFFTGIIADNWLGDRIMAKSIKDPNCSVMTDIVGVDFKTAHPVQYGAFTKVLGKFARDKKKMTLEEAVHKMTGLPASQMRLQNRGSISKGYYADITIFNPKTVGSIATFKDPHHLSHGIEYLLINGQIILEHGKYYADAFAGHVLRQKKKH